MSTGKVGVIFKDDFVVIDSTSQPVLSLTGSDFTTKLYKPDNTEDIVTSVSISELGNGLYRSSFTPTESGLWTLIVYNTTYFPEGKIGQVEVFNNNIDDIHDNTVRILGLSQENYYIDQNMYDGNGNLTSCRIRVYSVASSVGTASDVLATYTVTSTYTGNQLTTYKVVKQ